MPRGLRPKLMLLERFGREDDTEIFSVAR